MVNDIMIQRIQTLYLLVIAAFGIALIWLPVIEFVTPEEAETLRIWELSATGLTEITTAEMEPVVLHGLWGLLVTTVLIPILAIADIFLYKKRILQARLNIFLALLCLGYYGVIAIYIWLMKMSVERVEWMLDIWVAIPLINFIPDGNRCLNDNSPSVVSWLVRATSFKSAFTTDFANSSTVSLPSEQLLWICKSAFIIILPNL
jgi:hypothetical protein